MYHDEFRPVIKGLFEGDGERPGSVACLGSQSSSSLKDGRLTASSSGGFEDRPLSLLLRRRVCKIGKSFCNSRPTPTPPENFLVNCSNPLFRGNTSLSLRITPSKNVETSSAAFVAYSNSCRATSCSFASSLNAIHCSLPPLPSVC
jgi:hypothetical protein